MRFFYGFCLILFVCGSGLADTVPTQGVFKSVDGYVQVLQTNQNTVEAQQDLTVNEGDKIITRDNSSAVLRLFDGSELTISPSTQFTLTALQKTSEDDKVLKFKLFIGQLLAQVTKLTTSHSAFEIESGGVVCGVRGTEFSMSNNGQSKVSVQVFSGTVWTEDANGNHSIFKSGSMGIFKGGVQANNGGNSNNQSNNKIQNKSGGSTGGGTGSSTTGSTTGSGSSSNSGSGSSSSGSGTSSAGTGSTTGSGSGSTDSGTGSTTSNSGNSTDNTTGSTTSGGSSDNTTGSTTGGSGLDTGTSSTGDTGSNSAGSVVGSSTNNSLTDLNTQFQNNVNVNGNNTLNNPSVQGAVQLNVLPVMGK